MTKTILGVIFVCALITSSGVFAAECDDYAKNLKTCSPFKCKFKHPFGGQEMEKQIIGMQSGKCKTTEAMPNKGRMDCSFSPEMQSAVAKEIESLAASKSTDSHTSFRSDGKAESTNTIDGKVMKSALQEAMNNGQCVILGYH